MRLINSGFLPVRTRGCSDGQSGRGTRGHHHCLAADEFGDPFAGGVVQVVEWDKLF